MKYLPVLLLSLTCSSAFAESIDSIKKLPNGNNEIVYTLVEEGAGKASQYTLIDNDGRNGRRASQL